MVLRDLITDGIDYKYLRIRNLRLRQLVNKQADMKWLKNSRADNFRWKWINRAGDSPTTKPAKINHQNNNGECKKAAILQHTPIILWKINKIILHSLLNRNMSNTRHHREPLFISGYYIYWRDWSTTMEKTKHWGDLYLSPGKALQESRRVRPEVEYQR